MRTSWRGWDERSVFGAGCASGPPRGAQAAARGDEADAECRYLEILKIDPNSALTALARAWPHGVRGAKSRAMLGRCDGEFTEGLETADLLTARAVLERLRAD